MRFQIRLACDAEKHAVQQLDDLARGGDLNRSLFIHEAVANRRCLVAGGGDLVGYVVTAPKRFFDRDFVELLMVHEDYRRRGVGRVLLRAAVDRAGTSRVFSSTNESNNAMRSLFTAEGWTFSGRLDGLDHGDPEVVYFVDQQP